MSSDTFSVLLALSLGVAGFAVYRLSSWHRGRKVESSHIRGRTLVSYRQASNALAEALERQDPGFQFGRLRVPSHASYSHFAIVGATGSGKTLLQRLLMQSALPLIGLGHEQRALIYDPKQDVLPVLAGLKLRCPVHVLNPLDARSVAWDMAADIRTPAAAFHVASMFVPASRSDSNPFFTNAARHLIYGVIMGFIHAQRRWTLRQLLLQLRDPVQLKHHLNWNEATKFLVQYFEHPATAQNIISTLLAQLAPYEVIAAVWDRAEKSISLEEWMRSESILVLGNDEANRSALETVNRLIFRRLTELALAGSELTDFGPIARRTWFFLDEVREAGRLDGLSRLLTKGRSKGISVVLGFQDIAGLHDVYGKEVAEELVGQCSLKAILRLNSPETAAWASRVIGSQEVMETRHGHSVDLRRNLPIVGRDSASVSHGVVTRRAVLESEFLELPPASLENGVAGYFLTPMTGAFADHIPGTWLRTQLTARNETVDYFRARPVEHQFMKPWSRQDNVMPNTTVPDDPQLYLAQAVLLEK